LPDAIIAASALVANLPLMTRNVDDFRRIEGLALIDPFAGSTSPSAATRTSW
jgi:predicted nucleic acid-binding protein